MLSSRFRSLLRARNAAAHPEHNPRPSASEAPLDASADPPCASPREPASRPDGTSVLGARLESLQRPLVLLVEARLHEGLAHRRLVDQRARGVGAPIAYLQGRLGIAAQAVDVMSEDVNRQRRAQRGMAVFAQSVESKLDEMTLRLEEEGLSGRRPG